MRLVVLILSLMAVTGRDVCAQEPSYRFERRVDAVAVDIAVTDDGRPVDGLTEADFEIRDNGVLQTIDLVQVETAPVDAILVLDNSMSVAGPKLEELRAAVRSFVAGLGDADRVALVTFSGYVRLWQTLTVERAALLDALDGIVARGLTALKDGLYGGLSLAGPPAERPIVVLFSDGLDNASWTSESELLEVVRESNAVVYAVRSSLSLSEAWDRSSQIRGPTRIYRDKLLRAVTDESGGRFFEIDDGLGMASEFGRVVEEIRSRYLLTYYPTGVADDGWHDLDVKLKNGKAEVRARRGYYY